MESVKLRNKVKIGVFKRWVNSILRQKNIQVENLSKCFRDGVNLIYMYEILSGERLKGYKVNPKSILDRRFNLVVVLEKINILSIEITVSKFQFKPSHITSGSRMYIEGSESITRKETLLRWVRGRLVEYNYDVKDFSDSWKDGYAFSALLDSLDKSLSIMPGVKMSNNRRRNLENAFSNGEKIGIPRILRVEDITENCVVLYVACIYQHWLAMKIPENVDESRKLREQLGEYEEKLKTMQEELENERKKNDRLSRISEEKVKRLLEQKDKERDDLTKEVARKFQKRIEDLETNSKKRLEGVKKERIEIESKLTEKIRIQREGFEKEREMILEKSKRAIKEFEGEKKEVESKLKQKIIFQKVEYEKERITILEKSNKALKELKDFCTKEKIESELGSNDIFSLNLNNGGMFINEFFNDDLIKLRKCGSAGLREDIIGITKKLNRRIEEICSSVLTSGSKIRDFSKQKTKLIEMLEMLQKKRLLSSKLTYYKELSGSFQLELGIKDERIDNFSKAMEMIERAENFAKKLPSKIFVEQMKNKKVIDELITEIMVESVNHMKEEKYEQLKMKFSEITRAVKEKVTTKKEIEKFNECRNRILQNRYFDNDKEGCILVEGKLKNIVVKLNEILLKTDRKVYLSYMSEYFGFVNFVENTKRIEQLWTENSKVETELKKSEKDLRMKRFLFNEKMNEDDWVDENQILEEKNLLQKQSREIGERRLKFEKNDNICRSNCKKGRIMKYLIDRIENLSKKEDKLVVFLKKKGVYSNRTFKDYAIEKIIQPNSVYQCRFKHGIFNEPKVLKVLEYDKRNEVSTKNEILNLIKLKDHPSIVKINSVFLRKKGSMGKIYFEMDYYKRDLISWLKNIDWKKCETEKDYQDLLALPTKQERGDIVRVFFLILEAICYVHKNNVEHRDLKPMNVLINDICDVKIVDFGISKQCSFSTVQMLQYQGTIGYSPPEKKSSKAGDIYAFGRMLFEALIDPKYVELDFVTPKKHLEHIEAKILSKLLEKDPLKRITGEEALRHTFFHSHKEEKFGVVRKDEVLSVSKLLNETLNKNQKGELNLIMERKDVMKEIVISFGQIKNFNELTKMIKVRFQNEKGYGRGLTREAFSLFARQFVESEMFVDRIENFVLPTDKLDQRNHYYEFGKIFCRCLLEKRSLRVPFGPLVWYFVLKRRVPTKLEDWLCFCMLYDPIFCRSVSNIMNQEDFNYVKDDVDFFKFYDDEENERILNEQHKERYVKYVIQEKFLGSKFRIGNMEAFEKGFYSCLPIETTVIIRSILNCFELELLMFGQKKLSVEDLMKNIRFPVKNKMIDGYLKKWINEDSSEEQRFAFVRFITGLDGLTNDGYLLKDDKYEKIRVDVKKEDYQHKIFAHTCFFSLDVKASAFSSYEDFKKVLEGVLKNFNLGGMYD